MSLNKINIPSVKEAFVQQLESKILSGEFAIGERLPSARELCSLMGVSLTIVNAGMSELAAKGFVEIKPRCGVYVADYRTNGTTETMLAVFRYNGGKLNANDVRSFCESRVALDPFVAKLVIERASDEQLDELRPLVEKLRTERDTDLFCTTILEFFRRLYQLSGNIVFSLLYKSTLEPQRGMYAVFIEKNGLDIVAENAVKVYRLLLERDVDRVQKCLVDSMQLPLSGDTSII